MRTYLPEFLDGSREKGNKHREGVLNAFLHVAQRLIEGYEGRSSV